MVSVKANLKGQGHQHACRDGIKHTLVQHLYIKYVMFTCTKVGFLGE